MADSFSIEVQSQEVTDLLVKLKGKLTDMSPVMASIAMAMHSQAQKNFEDEAGPDGAWHKLSDTTIAMRTKAGSWPGKILQNTGGLSGALYSTHDASSARVGAAKVYAAMHQLGGTTSPHSMIPGKTIPARPFLPVSASGQLQGDAESTILEILNHYLSS